MRKRKSLAFGHWPLAFSRQPSAISRWPLRIAALAAIALLLLAGVALADETYEISWFSVDGGGGGNAGGAYALVGAIGQPDAGALSGGGYTLVGGFWAGAGPDYWRYLPVVMKQ